MDVSFRRLASFAIAATVKVVVRFFYWPVVKWVRDPGFDPWKDVRVFVFLNHTSLYEVLFITAFPFQFIWQASSRCALAVASKTMERPIIGKFFKFLAPKSVSLTRKRDGSWQEFMNKVDGDAIIAILPEGRMMRENGLDSQGNPMSVRGGIADILQKLDSGTMLMMYSGGLHHVQVPGQKFPNLFRKIRLNYDAIKIEEYKAALWDEDSKLFKKNVMADMEQRKAEYCPV